MPTARAKKETATTTRKVATKVDTKVTAEEQVIAEKPIEEKIEKEKKVFTDSDYILCRSVCYGGLNITSQSGNIYEFKDYGYDCEINYRDLVSLIRKGSDHIFLPRFVILDDDLLEDFPTVKRAYEKMYTRNDLLKILDMPTRQMEMEMQRIEKLNRKKLISGADFI